MIKYLKINKIIFLTFIITLAAILPKGAFAYWSIYSVSGFGLPAGTVTGIVVGVLYWILYLFGFLGILGFVISGILYLLSTGDDDMMKRAKQAMQYSILGVVVGLSGVVAIKLIYAILSQGYLF